MPAKPAESSPLRRVLVQSIMWLILAATVGLAALVDVRKAHSSVVALGEPRSIEDFTMRFPSDWDANEDERVEPDAALELREPIYDETARKLAVRIDRPSLSKVLESFSARAAHRMTASVIIPFGDQSATLRTYRELAFNPIAGEAFYQLRYEVFRDLGHGRMLTLILVHRGIRGSSREQNQDVELIKKVAATLVTNSR